MNSMNLSLWPPRRAARHSGPLAMAARVCAALVCGAIAGCQTPAPAPPPERPAALVSAVSFDKAIDFAVDDLLIQAQRLPEFQPAAPASGVAAAFRKEQPAPPKVRIIVDNALDGVTGQQTVATRALDSRLLEGVVARFPAFQVAPISAGDVASARFILTTTVAVLERGQGKAASFRLNFSLTDSRSGIVVAQASAQATGETVDTTPTAFYRDSPSVWPPASQRPGLSREPGGHRLRRCG